MRLLSPVKLLAFVATLAIGATAARAQTVASALANFDTDVRQYNLVALSTTATTTFSQYGDTQGGIAIAGNLSISGGSIDDQVSTAPDPSLYVSGKLTLSGGSTLNAAYASIATSNSSSYTWNSTNHDLVANNGSGDLNITNSGSTVNPIGAAGPSSWNWSTTTSQLTADATTLANAKANGTTVIAGSISVNSQNLIFTPSSTPAAGSTVIFTLNAADLSGNSYNGNSFSNISINVPDDVNYVINVINVASNQTLFSGANFNSGSNDTNLLWNIEGSCTVNLASGSFYGSILAPTATITNNGDTTINGQVVANAFSDTNTELHFLGFDAVAVVIPEPMTFALWGLGLCGVAIVARRKLVS